MAEAGTVRRRAGVRGTSGRVRTAQPVTAVSGIAGKAATQALVIELRETAATVPAAAPMGRGLEATDRRAGTVVTRRRLDSAVRTGGQAMGRPGGNAGQATAGEAVKLLQTQVIGVGRLRSSGTTGATSTRAGGRRRRRATGPPPSRGTPAPKVAGDPPGLIAAAAHRRPVLEATRTGAGHVVPMARHAATAISAGTAIEAASVRGGVRRGRSGPARPTGATDGPNVPAGTAKRPRGAQTSVHGGRASSNRKCRRR